MEPMEKLTDCPKDPFCEEKDPQVNCFECFAKTPCYNAVAAQFSIRQPRPKFLSTCPFRKRFRMEFFLSKKALAKFLESKLTQPLVQLPDQNQNLSVWELARTMAEWMKSSFSSTVDKKAPITEEPIPRIKEFPLTQESVKKYIEKETAKKKEEKQETVHMLRKKLQGLRKLKDELSLQQEKQSCHLYERLGDYEEEKMRYLQRLADQYNLKMALLMRNGDFIYQNYRSEMKKMNERKIKEIEKRTEVNARLLQEELNRQKQLKQLKSPMVPKFIAKKGEETPPYSEIVEEEEVKNVSFVLGSMERRSSVPLRLAAHYKKRKSSKSKLRVTESRRSIKMKPKLKPNRSPSPSKVELELNAMMKKMETIWDEIDRAWNEEKSEPELPDNSLLIVRPTSVVFNDFLPYTDYVEIINIYNPTKDAMDCGFYKCCVEPQFQGQEMFEVFPELVMRIRPGGNQDFKLIFMTERWDDVKDGIQGIVWFWSKVLKTNDFYRIPIQVQCIRFTSNIKVENPIIEFDQVPSWDNACSTKYLEITNNSQIDYEVYIHRKNEKEEINSLFSPSSHLTEKRDENKLVTIEEGNETPSQESINHPLENVTPERKKHAHYSSEQPADPTSSEKHKDQRNPNKSRDQRSLEQHRQLRHDGVRNQEHILSRHSHGVRSHHSLPHKKFAKNESLLAAKDMLESMIEEVYQPFRVQLTRGVFLNRETKMCVPIEFLPELAGNVKIVKAQLVVSYEGRFLTKGEEVVTLIANMFDVPVSISTAMVDMQVTMVGTGVWQTSFQVTNLTNKFVKVKIYLPNKMCKHFQARPNNFIIRPNQKEGVLLRATIGWNICEDAGDMLDETLSLLEFPISIKANDLPIQELGTLAVISHPLALSIEPQLIKLGYVNTFETVIEEFWLRNHTVVPLHFAFINVPECVLIMPKYGFSVIGPAQKIKLQLLYSPGIKEAGKAGGQAFHMFTLMCTTMERLAADKPATHNFISDEEVLDNLKLSQIQKSDQEPVSTLQDLLKMHKDSSILETGEFGNKSIENLAFLNENLNSISFLEKTDVISPIDSKTGLKNPVNFGVHHITNNFSAQVNYARKSGIKLTDMTVVEEPYSALKKHVEPFISLTCMSVVTDPLCELSSQQVVLPDTPYGSFSMNYIYLRCPNEVSGTSCYCGKFVGLHDDPKQLNIRFQFFQPEKDLEIQPVTGNLNYGEKIKIYLILRPELDVGDNSREIKIKKPPKKKKMKTESRIQIKATDSQISKTRLIRIKNKPIVKFHTRIRCLISINGIDFESRYEELYCDLFSKFTRPVIYVVTPNSRKEIIFAKTAIGGKRTETLFVYNISNQLVHLTRSHFCHKDIFVCQTLPPSPWIDKEYNGIPIEPDGALKVRLSFTPVDENLVEEYFEFKAKNTIIPLKVSGQGGLPRFGLSSQFCVCKLESSPGNKAEDVITITNKCDVELRFEITKCFQLETTSSDVFKVFLNKYSPAKNIYKESSLDQSIMIDIEKYFYESNQPSPITVEPPLIIVPPFKKGVIKIVFYPVMSVRGNSSAVRTTRSMSSRIQKVNEAPHKKDRERASRSRTSDMNWKHSKIKLEEPSATFYVQKVQLTLGKLTMVAEWLIIGKVTKKK
ncbi:uncharacterized protein [Halyomorpha halys]|uniref:uncharacterized protein isoform X1 n=1 Tax=Halyomorpha halys TaxID=286706 RepID=UPI0006D513DB